MTLDQIIPELKNLSRAEKLQAMQILADELAAEEVGLIPGATYEIFTPYGNEEAAQVLYEFLLAAQTESRE